MGKGAIILAILCIVIAVTLTFFYFKYQVPLNKEYSNVSISAEYDGKKIKTGFIVDGTSGETNEAYELVKVQKNKEILVENINLENQSFYKISQRINITKDNQRIDLKLEKPIEPEVQIVDGNPIAIQIDTPLFKDMKICLTWSLNYVFVNAQNLTSIEKLKGYENWDRCYETDFSSGSMKVYVDYSEFNTILERDYINISLITPEFLGTQDKKMRIE